MELKSLVYEYKDNKDDQIKKLEDRHGELKVEIEKNEKNYSLVIEDTTNQIENFIKKMDTNTSLDN